MPFLVHTVCMYVCTYVHMLQVLTMRHYRVTCVILQHLMRQCSNVTIQPACHIVNDAKKQKGGVSVLPLTDLNLRQEFLPSYHCVFLIFFVFRTLSTICIYFSILLSLDIDIIVTNCPIIMKLISNNTYCWKILG
jgi:hypothetical protein